MVTTLDFNYKNWDRRSGNTTRQVDFAIQKLFEEHVIIVEDHFESGRFKPTNLDLLSRIVKRLYFEHYINKEDLEIDVKPLQPTIKLKENGYKRSN